MRSLSSIFTLQHMSVNHAKKANPTRLTFIVWFLTLSYYLVILAELNILVNITSSIIGFAATGWCSVYQRYLFIALNKSMVLLI